MLDIVKKTFQKLRKKFQDLLVLFQNWYNSIYLMTNTNMAWKYNLGNFLEKKIDKH